MVVPLPGDKDRFFAFIDPFSETVYKRMTEIVSQRQARSEFFSFKGLDFAWSQFRNGFSAYGAFHLDGSPLHSTIRQCRGKEKRRHESKRLRCEILFVQRKRFDNAW